MSTSIIERFPDTLIEAEMCGLLHVSFLDPDNVVRKSAVGISASSLNEMVEAVKMLSEHEGLRQTLEATRENKYTVPQYQQDRLRMGDNHINRRRLRILGICLVQHPNPKRLNRAVYYS